MILMPLKAKYRSKSFKIEKQQSASGPIDTKVRLVGGKSRTNNSGKKKSDKTLRPRRKVYGPF
jgi:hypothetical protein